MSTSPPVRRPRADAARNRQRLIDVARAAFAGGADPSLEGIARDAGVGIGTLYRNFPTREDLVAAAYGSELDALLATVDTLLADHDAVTGLREFARHYADFVRTKRGMAETVRVGALRSAAESAHTRERMNAAVRRFLEHGSTDGSLRRGIEADDVTAALVGVLLATRDSDDPGQTDRLLDIVVDGLASR